MDSIEIRGLSCRCIIGIRARERRERQRVELDVELGADLERAGRSGRIAHTVDYSRASTELIALLQFRRYLLLEMAAEECVGWLFAAHANVRSVTLRVAKPQALKGQAESAGVRIARARPAEAQRQTTSFGFVESLLETSEATVLVIGIEPGQRVTLAALGFESALALPLVGHLESGRPLAAHEPVELRAGSELACRDSGQAQLALCGRRPHPT